MSNYAQIGSINEAFPTLIALDVCAIFGVLFRTCRSFGYGSLKISRAFKISK